MASAASARNRSGVVSPDAGSAGSGGGGSSASGEGESRIAFLPSSASTFRDAPPHPPDPANLDPTGNAAHLLQEGSGLEPPGDPAGGLFPKVLSSRRGDDQVEGTIRSDVQRGDEYEATNLDLNPISVSIGRRYPRARCKTAEDRAVGLSAEGSLLQPPQPLGRRPAEEIQTHRRTKRGMERRVGYEPSRERASVGAEVGKTSMKHVRGGRVQLTQRRPRSLLGDPGSPKVTHNGLLGSRHSR